MSNINLSGLGNLADDMDGARQLRQIRSYLIQLTEQLRFVLNNLDEENLSPELIETISGATERMHQFEDALGNYSTVKQTTDMIQTTVGDLNLDQYSTITQTSDAIAVAVADKADASALASLEAQFADAILNGASMDDLSAIAAQFNDALGDKASISFVNLTATNLSSLIADKASVSYVNQTAGSLNSSISNVSGRVSVLEQSDSSVAIKLQNPAISTAFEARVAQAERNPNGSWNEYGVYLYENGVYHGGIWVDNVLGGIGVGSESRRTLVIGSELWLMGPNGIKIIIGTHASGRQGIQCMGDLLPVEGNTYNLGGNGQGMRWQTVYTNNSLNISDLRFKRDIAPLNAAWLLDKLRPIRYRLTESEERDGKLRFGFGVQPIQAAIAGTDIEGANLIDTSNPDRYNMSYKDLIAVLVEGYQQQQQEINALKRAMGGAA